MPTLVLPLRITPDTDAMLAAAKAARWEALRLNSWRVPQQPLVVDNIKSHPQAGTLNAEHR
jgi:hypothetical protein